MIQYGLLQQVAQQDVPDDSNIQGGLLGAIGQKESSSEPIEHGLLGEVSQPYKPMGLLEFLGQKELGK